MSVTLTPQAEHRIRDWIADGRYATVAGAIDAAVQFLDASDRERRLRAALLAAEEQTREGRVAEWTPELRERLRREAEERFQRGERPGPHVCP